MACENEELIQVKAEKHEEDSEIVQPSSYIKKEDPACKILKECDNCKFKTEKEGPMCFNLFGEKDFCRPTFTETLSDINEKNDNLFMQIYGANSKFIGRSLEVCSQCNVFQVHNLFSRTENELFIKLRLGGFAQAVSNNIIKTCESKGKETRCQMVGICNLPRSSPAYAILHGDESLDLGRCENLKIASPNEKITYRQSLLGRPSTAEYLTSTEETGKPHSIKAFREFASFDLNSYKHFSSINETHNLPMKESPKYLEMHTSSGVDHGYDMRPSGNLTRNHDSLFTESSLLSEYGGEYFKLRYGPSPSGLKNTHSLRTVTTSRTMSPYLDTSIRSEESSPSQICNPQGSVQSSVPSDCNATISSVMLGGKRPHDRLEEHSVSLRRNQTSFSAPKNESAFYGGIENSDNEPSARLSRVVTRYPASKVPKFSAANNVYFESEKTPINFQTFGTKTIQEAAQRENTNLETIAIRANKEDMIIPEKIVGNENGLDKQETYGDIKPSDITSVSEWSNEDVVAFFRKTDCAEYARVFQEEEVDGKSLLLLDEEKLNKLLGIKIGPAMKIARQIQKLKSCFAPEMPANSEC